MIGQIGVVKKALEPVGTILVVGELWQADSDPGAGPIAVGAAGCRDRARGFPPARAAALRTSKDETRRSPGLAHSPSVLHPLFSVR